MTAAAGQVAKTWLARLALALLGVASALVVFELGLLIANHWFPYFYCSDARRGWGLRPGASGFYRREGRAFVAINHDGFRGRDYQRPKPPATLRVAVLGDSYTEAMQVAAGETFCSVIERELGPCAALAGRRVEVLNFGVDGYGTAQELVTLREKVWAYSPDVVVLAFFPGNDVRNNSVTLEGDQCRPFFIHRGGRLVVGGPFIDSASFRLWCMTRFDYRAGNVLGLAENAWEALEMRQRGPTVDYPVERAINYNVYKPPADAAWREAWRVTEDLIAQMHTEVAARGASFLVVTLDAAGSWPDPRVSQFFMKRFAVSDFFYPDRRIAALGQREGFEVLNLAQPLQAYAQAHHAFLHGFPNTQMGFGHWNALGHRVAGKMMARKLCAMIGAGKNRAASVADHPLPGAPVQPGAVLNRDPHRADR